MIRELRVMRRKGGRERAKANYISTLQARGKISKKYSKAGYIAYDPHELAEYKKQSKVGRPCKED